MSNCANDGKDSLLNNIFAEFLNIIGIKEFIRYTLKGAVFAETFSN